MRLHRFHVVREDPLALTRRSISSPSHTAFFGFVDIIENPILADSRMLWVVGHKVASQHVPYILMAKAKLPVGGGRTKHQTQSKGCPLYPQHLFTNSSDMGKVKN